MVARNRVGFTLVELLVVIVIIAMLAGLLTPALISSRRSARITQCSNNQRELASAIVQYDTAKGHLPGYVNPVGSSAVSWVPVLFPYLGRMDLWEGNPSASINGWRSGNPTTAAGGVCVQVKQLICPDLPGGALCQLSYVVNVGTISTTTPDFWQDDENGVFGNRVATSITSGANSGKTSTPKNISLSSIKSSSQRLLLSERQYPVGTIFNNGQPTTSINGTTKDREWSSLDPTAPLTDTNLTANYLTSAQLGFYWPRTTTSPMPKISDQSILPPIHAGIVIVTFCDGHVESLSAPETIDCSVYDCSDVTQ